MKRRIFLLLLLSVSSFKLSSQVNTDAQFMFKTWLFLDRENVYLKDATKKMNKDDSLFYLFNSTVSITIDTLYSKGFSNAYSFYFLNVTGDKCYKNISYIETVSDDYEQYLNIYGNCSGYIIGVNQRTGESYRLSGFNGNDFLNFLSDVKKKTGFPYFLEGMSNKHFFKYCTVEGLDFKCLFTMVREKNCHVGLGKI